MIDWMETNSQIVATTTKTVVVSQNSKNQASSIRLMVDQKVRANDTNNNMINHQTKSFVSRNDDEDDDHQEDCSNSRCRRRKVLFQLQRSRLYAIPRLDDLPVEEIKATWYEKEDYKAIREANKVTIKLLNATTGTVVDPERFGHCFRGLEYRNPNQGRYREELMRKGVHAVLATQQFCFEIQEQQQAEQEEYEEAAQEGRSKQEEEDDTRDNCINNNIIIHTDDNTTTVTMELSMEEQISKSYSSETWQAQQDAQLRGVNDAATVQSIWAVRPLDQAPTIPRRTWARAG
jgi:hypothetical protein